MSSSWVLNVGDADFDQSVLEGSKKHPVVADFWASWCGPCRTLGPLLESLAEDHSGEFILAKIDVDKATEVAQRYKVRSIPTVLGFRDGRVVSEFVGAQPESAVQKFLGGLLPSPADRLAAEGVELALAGHLNAAEERFKTALDLDSRQAHALLGLGRLLAGEGANKEALDLVDRILPSSPLSKEADRFSAEIRTMNEGGGDIDGLELRLQENPGDLQIRLELAQALCAKGAFEDALEQYLKIVGEDSNFGDEAARKAMLDVFEILGSDNPLTGKYRSELAKALFR